MDIDHGFKYIEKLRAVNQWYMMESEDFISHISFEIKNETGGIVTLHGQPITL